MKIIHLVEDTERSDIAAFIKRIEAIGGQHQIIEVGSWKFITHRFEADLIISHLTISWRRLPFLISLRNRHPSACVMHIEHTYCEGYVECLGKPQGRLFNVLRIAYSLFNRVIAISKGQGKWLLSCALVPVSRLLIIPYIVDITQLTNKPRRFAKDSPLRLLYIGDRDYGSGLDILLDAFSTVKQSGDHLTVMLTKSSLEETLPDRCQKILDTDEHITQITADQSSDLLYKQADIVAVPSRWGASSPIGQEARAAGCVAVTSGVDGLEEQSASVELIFGTDVESWKYGLKNIRFLPLDTYAKLGQERVQEEHAIFLRRWQSLLNTMEMPGVDEKEIREALRA